MRSDLQTTKTLLMLFVVRVWSGDNEYSAWTICEVRVSWIQAPNFNLSYCDYCFIPQNIRSNFLVAPELVLFQNAVAVSSVFESSIDSNVVQMVDTHSWKALVNGEDTSMVHISNTYTSNYNASIVVCEYPENPQERLLATTIIKNYSTVTTPVLIWDLSHPVLSQIYHGIYRRIGTSLENVSSRSLDFRDLEEFNDKFWAFVVLVTCIHAVILIVAFLIRRKDAPILFIQTGKRQSTRRRRRLLRVFNKLPIPVFKINYVATSLLCACSAVSDILVAIFRQSAIVYIFLIIFTTLSGGAFACFSLRVANATRKVKMNWKLSKRISIAIIPGFIVGLSLGCVYCAYRKQNSFQPLWIFLCISITVAILLHLNFRTLGAILLNTALIMIFEALMAFLKKTDVTFGYAQSLNYRSNYLGDANPIITRFGIYFENASMEINHQWPHLVHERNPFMYYMEINKQMTKACKITFQNFTPLYTALSTEFFAFFCLIYNLEWSQKSSIWFTVCIFLMSVPVYAADFFIFHPYGGLIHFVHFIVLLLFLLTVAGIRKELRLLFCGLSTLDDDDFVSRSIVSSGTLTSLSSQDQNLSRAVDFSEHGSRDMATNAYYATVKSTTHDSYYDSSPYTLWRSKSEKEDFVAPYLVSKRSSSLPNLFFRKLTGLPPRNVDDSQNSSYVTFY